MTDTNTFLRDSALWYATVFEWRVFPLSPRSKIPFPGSHGFRDATVDTRKIETWWNEHPAGNVAIATGNCLLVLDCDPRNDGNNSISTIEKQCGKLASTPCSLTGGGGRQWFFSTRGKSYRSCNGIMPGLDIKCEDGYVVAPPSIHPCGKQYAWDIAAHPNDLELLPVPEWLDRLLTVSQTSRASGDWRALVPNAFPQGSRNSSLASVVGGLLRSGVGAYDVLEYAQYLNSRNGQPPLNESEVRNIVNSICRSELVRRGRLS